MRTVATSGGIALALCLLALQGCSTEFNPTNYSLWVHQFRCLEGVDPAHKYLTCKGRSEDAGVLEMKLFPAQRFALVHVVVQDPKNPSVDLFQVTGCNIWDRDNWDCTESSGSTYTITYVVRDGIYAQAFFGSFPTETRTDYVGTVHEGQASAVKRALLQ